MTAGSRPNLSGLFTGSTPPERSTAVASALGPESGPESGPEPGPEPVSAPSVSGAQHDPVQGDDAVETEPAAALGNPAAARGSGATRQRSIPVPPLGAPTHQGHLSAALELIDPLRAVERYFAFLQVVLDVNRRVAVAVTGTALSLPRRAGIWR